jgi:ectoine hydroxylase-related dioxygenase (phytanoyl-CoA dioxygenase family)
VGRKWLGAEYEAGDVVLHHPYNIHCSAVNGTEVIRLATDLSFVETGKRFDKRWMGTLNVRFFCCEMLTSFLMTTSKVGNN